MLKNKDKKRIHFITIWKRKCISFVLMMLFVFFSILFISPKVIQKKTNYRSSELEIITTKYDNTVRTDYVDSTGQLTIAADQGYATIVVTEAENGKLEKYYDDNGMPIKKSDGYYGVLREYNPDGNNTKNTYLDIDDKPMITLSGYAIVRREYDENRNIKAIRYYDADDNPVCTNLYGYGRIYQYDDSGKKVKTTFIDADGNPMMTSQGYAIIAHHYQQTEGTEKNKTENELYYDEKGKHIALSLGQYGTHKEYNENGQATVLTYLDQNEKPAATNKGYTTIIRAFNPNNTVITERYYDLEGNPFALPEGQYGIKKENGQTIYLNKDGRETFNVKTILYNNSKLVILVTLILVILSGMADKKVNGILLILYIFSILYLTLMFRESGEGKTIAILEYYKQIFTKSEVRADILKNIWLFIPLGAILYQLYPHKIILLVPVILSFAIETTQLLAEIGSCELDDVISNSLGGGIGYLAGKLTTDLKQRINRRKQIHSV